MPTSTRKIIAITGVTRGLGRALAEGFAAAGHRILGCGRTSEALADLRDSLGGDHDFAVVDVADDAEVATWSARILGLVGPPDLLVGNAAVINPNAPLWKVSAADFDRVVDVNIKGIANAIRHLVPAMIARGTGVVVNFSSGWGRSTSPEVAPYCASKWAIEGLTRALAQELPRGLAAVALNPGIIDTAMLRSTFGDGASSYPDPRTWAESAIPYLIRLGPADNGVSLTVPGH
jgi:NAD(P)-dependent dehydrogenase (short-subunit alcohol dehydrogenase family)